MGYFNADEFFKLIYENEEIYLERTKLNWSFKKENGKTIRELNLTFWLVDGSGTRAEFFSFTGEKQSAVEKFEILLEWLSKERKIEIVSSYLALYFTTGKIKDLKHNQSRGIISCSAKIEQILSPETVTQRKDETLPALKEATNPDDVIEAQSTSSSLQSDETNWLYGILQELDSMISKYTK